MLILPSRSYVKKKPDYTDHPQRYRPSVLVKTLRGFQFSDGDPIFKGDILVRQLGLEFYPGENVSLNSETWDIVANCNGRFMITTEELSPYPDSPLYATVKSGNVIKKHFVHVIEEDSATPSFIAVREL
ncbi:unnamed protein product [Protopolystoma xenopodis]|uniref:Uncharacterized protein n=1 Tax=Protopolystoma xenopodis TaxID=117903 RepID=A0A448WWF0_9PLAT|nr:unnamed protein product [Protopolystoma xenopodis]